MIRLRFARGVPRRVRESVRDFARWAEAALDVRHEVRVYVTSRERCYDEGEPCNAVCFAPDRRREPFRVRLAGQRWIVYEYELGYGPEEALRHLLHDFAHELVHYEQWRDGVEFHHRGIERRAAALVRRYDRDRGHG